MTSHTDRNGVHRANWSFRRAHLPDAARIGPRCGSAQKTLPVEFGKRQTARHAGSRHPLSGVLTRRGAPTLIGGSHQPYLQTQGFMTYPYKHCRFARAPATVALGWALRWALWSMLLSVNITHSASNASFDVSPDTGHAIPAGDTSFIGSLNPPREPIDFSGRARPASPTSPTSPTNASSISQAHEFAQLRAELAVANTADTTTAATPIPEPTEYMLLAGGLLILWGSLRWKNRTRRPVNTPRSRLKKR